MLLKEVLMQELTITEQEAINGGTNWWAAAGAGFEFAAAGLEWAGKMGMEVPDIGARLALAGAACGLIGALMN